MFPTKYSFLKSRNTVYAPVPGLSKVYSFFFFNTTCLKQHNICILQYQNKDQTKAARILTLLQGLVCVQGLFCASAVCKWLWYRKRCQVLFFILVLKFQILVSWQPKYRLGYFCPLIGQKWDERQWNNEAWKAKSVATSVGKCDLHPYSSCIQLQTIPQGIQLSKRSQVNGAGGRDSATEAHTLVSLQREIYISTRWRKNIVAGFYEKP